MVNIAHIPVSVELKLPAYGSVKTLLSICYIIYNRTPFPQEIEVNMEASDSFMFAGNKQVKLKEQNDWVICYTRLYLKYM